MSKTNVKHQR